MPVFNREKEVVRALKSCLDQAFHSLEIIVVDDGSSDGSVEAVRMIAAEDGRVRLFSHAANRGVCPARNTGIAHANGDWLLMLDSDMSLLPGALVSLESAVSTVGVEVGNLITAVAWDTGIKTPIPLPEKNLFDYSKYVEWMESLIESEYFNCIRREVFAKGLSYPESRAYEGGFHLDLAKHWRIYFLNVLTITYHTDAANRLCAPQDWRLKRRQLEVAAYDVFRESQRIEEVHGAILAAKAPVRWERNQYLQMLSAFLAGERWLGLRYWLLFLLQFGFRIKPILVMPAGLLHRRALSTLLSIPRIKLK